MHYTFMPLHLFTALRLSLALHLSFCRCTSSIHCTSLLHLAFLLSLHLFFSIPSTYFISHDSISHLSRHPAFFRLSLRFLSFLIFFRPPSILHVTSPSCISTSFIPPHCMSPHRSFSPQLACNSPSILQSQPLLSFHLPLLSFISILLPSYFPFHLPLCISLHPAFRIHPTSSLYFAFQCAYLSSHLSGI